MFEALGRGVRILFGHKKAVLSLYLLNLSMALLLAVPFMSLLEESLGQGLYRERLSGNLDYDWYVLFQERAQGAAATFSPGTVLGLAPFARNLGALLDGELTGFPAAIVALALLYLFLNSFVTAAAVGTLAFDPNGNNLREFFRTGGEFFGRFFRITLMALAAYGLIHIAVLEPLRGLIHRAAVSAATDRSAFYWEFSHYLVIVAFLLLLNFVFDYAKIFTAVEDRSSVFLSLVAALRFCWTRFRSAFALYLLVGAIGLVWVLIYGAVESLIPQESGAGILAAFLFQQLYMVGRLSVRVLFYAAQMHFFLKREGLWRPDENIELCPPESETESAAVGGDSE